MRLNYRIMNKIKVYRTMLDIIGNALTIEDLTKEIYERLRNALKCDRIAFASIEKDEVITFTAASNTKNLKLKAGFREKISQNYFSLKDIKIMYIKDLEAYLRENPFLEGMKLLVEEGMKSIIMIPISIKNIPRGLLFLSSKKIDGFTNVDKEIFVDMKKLLDTAYQKTILTDKLIFASAMSFINLASTKDEETGAHIVRMATYSKLIAEELSMMEYSSMINEAIIDQIYRQAPLHDIGKIGIPDSILLKKGKLDANEFEIMKTHTILGWKVLEAFDKEASKFGRNFFTIGKLIVRHHHERWDGKGYPDGLSGQQIPLCARIAAVADVFDALTTRRPYKVPFDFDSSFEMILPESGSHFDPLVVKAFQNKRETIKMFYDEFKVQKPSEYT